MMDKSQVWAKAWDRRALTLLEEHKTTWPPCLGDKPREMKTQKGTNTNLHNNFIHSNQKWTTSHFHHCTTGKCTMLCTCNGYYLARQTKGNYYCIKHREISKLSIKWRKPNSPFEKSPSVWNPTAGKQASAYRIQITGCSRLRDGKKEANANGPVVLWGL